MNYILGHLQCQSQGNFSQHWEILVFQLSRKIFGEQFSSKNTGSQSKALWSCIIKSHVKVLLKHWHGGPKIYPTWNGVTLIWRLCLKVQKVKAKRTMGGRNNEIDRGIIWLGFILGSWDGVIHNFSQPTVLLPGGVVTKMGSALSQCIDNPFFTRSIYSKVT